MRPIFNSLGSNYDLSFVLLALKQIFVGGNRSTDDRSIDKLHRQLDKIYLGKSFLFYKGRDAIEFSLKVLFDDDNKGKVLTQAFSCFAVEEGINRSGMTPAYVDIDQDSTNMSVETLSKALAKNKNSKAVLIQHSLGIPADIIAVKKWCKQNNLLLIEDLAQAIGGVDATGQRLGENADAVIFSFGRDKIIDAVSGGAVVFKNLNDKQIAKIEVIKTSQVESLSKDIFTRDMVYPLITFLGRKTYCIFVGKIILKLSRTFGLISSPTISKTKKMTRMSSAYARLILNSLLKLDKQIIQRRKIANLYLDKISNENIKIINTKNDVETGSNIRFSIATHRVKELIVVMKKKNIHLSDRWYRTPVDCGKHSCNSVYSVGQAQNAEKLSEQVFNLPTHRNISVRKAKKIINVLNEF